MVEQTPTPHSKAKLGHVNNYGRMFVSFASASTLQLRRLKAVLFLQRIRTFYFLLVYTFTSRLERVGRIELPTQPWEGRVLPLNHTRRRFAVYGLVALLASQLLAFAPAHAQTVPTPVHFNESLIASGWTVKLDSGANITVFPGMLTAPADVTWATSTDTPPALPTNMSLLGSLYHLTISGVTSLDTTKYKLAAAIPDAKSYWSHGIWYYDMAAKTWTQATTKLNTTTGKLQAGVASLDAYVAILQDATTEVGNATWYCKNHCSAKYPKLHATSNDFPVGSTVTVTNPDNGKSVNVKIVSRWGQPAGRVIDLSWAAYDVLKAKNSGVTKVSVTSKKAAAVTPTTPVTSTTETIPSLTVTGKGAPAKPDVSGTAYSVVDAATGTTLAVKNGDTVMPIASITKLMTAMVFLDTKPDMNKVVTYSKADVTAYAYLQVKPTEQLSNKDLLYSMLVGSANNAATALARSTGMTTAEFLTAMNAKAASWGLTNTTYVDVHGLNPENTSTANDLAVIAAHAFHDYPIIRKATTVTSYAFVTKNTKIRHTIKSTDKLLLNPGTLTITGGKTGYLDEARYTYALRAKNSQGAQVIVIMLNSPTTSQRFSDSAKLATWAWNAFTWT